VSAEVRRVLLANGERNLIEIERRLGVRIHARGDLLAVEGGDDPTHKKAVEALRALIRAAELGGSEDDRLGELASDAASQDWEKPILYDARGGGIRPRSVGQVKLVEAVTRNSLTFATGPAGTGKTFLAIAMAVAALEKREIDRIVLVRPAVEAGESLGFLPGDLKEKIAPYLQPMFDALGEMMPRTKFKERMEDGTIELAPLAYMRGRTLSRSFVILDEAQNTTTSQMMMLLTRIGARSKAVVTGDPSQCDLGPRETSGLSHACKILEGIDSISIVKLQASDQMRHPLVRAIIEAYERDADDAF
jgi:phosphate starvation-inducible PhoH-like protein